jgi:hypothetical protein
MALLCLHLPELEFRCLVILGLSCMLQYLPSTSDRKAAFEEFCTEAGAKKLQAAASPAATKALAVPVSEAVNAGAPSFEQLLDEVQAACSGAAPAPSPVPAAGEEEGQLLPAWNERLSLFDLEARWGSDPRWQACSSEQRRTLLDARLAPLRQAARQHCEANYRTLLREKGVQAESRWSRIKQELAGDPRYQALSRADRWVRQRAGRVCAETFVLQCCSCQRCLDACAGAHSVLRATRPRIHPAGRGSLDATPLSWRRPRRFSASVKKSRERQRGGWRWSVVRRRSGSSR